MQIAPDKVSFGMYPTENYMLDILFANIGQMIFYDKIEHLRAEQALCCFQSKFQKPNW